MKKKSNLLVLDGLIFLSKSSFASFTSGELNKSESTGSLTDSVEFHLSLGDFSELREMRGQIFVGDIVSNSSDKDLPTKRIK